jgi:hypothetical protein
MRRSAISLALLFVMSLVLVACATPEEKAKQEIDPNIAPANYKQEIIDTLTTTLTDPTNVRDAFITAPMLGTAGKEPRYIVCVRYNGRDGSRQYTGSKDLMGVFYGGHLNQLIDPTKDQCVKVAYQPFPELEKLCLAKKCE